MLPCILNSSGGIFLIIIDVISIIFILYWFFATYGVKDLKAVTVGAKTNASDLLSRSFSSNKPPSAEVTDGSPPTSHESPAIEPARSSENLNTLKSAPPQKSLLRLLIFLLTLASALLLIGHLSFTFTSSYTTCNRSFLLAFPNLDDSSKVNSGGTGSWEDFRSTYADSAVNSVAYPSSMMLDIARATLVVSIVLLVCDYPGAVYRHLSASVSKNYFENWWDWFTRLGYLYAIVSFFITIVVRTLLSPSSPNLALVAVNMLLDSELLALGLIFLFYFGLFLIKRSVKSPRVHVSVTSPAEVNERAKKSMARLVAKPISLLFAETSLVLTILLFAQAITDIILMIWFAIGDRPNTSMSKMVFYALYFIHYLTLPIIYIVTMLVMYPRYDPNSGEPRPHQLPPGVSDSWLRSEGSRGDFRRYSVPATMLHRAPDESFAANYLPNNWQTMRGRTVNTDYVARTRSQVINTRAAQTYNQFPMTRVESTPIQQQPVDNPFAVLPQISPNRASYQPPNKKRAPNPKFWSVPVHNLDVIERPSNRTSQHTGSTATERGPSSSSTGLVSPTPTQFIPLHTKRLEHPSALGLDIDKPSPAMTPPQRSRRSIVDDSSIAILSSYGYPVGATTSANSNQLLHSTVPIHTRSRSSTSTRDQRDIRMETSHQRLSLGVISDIDNSSLNSSTSNVRASDYPEFQSDMRAPHATGLASTFSTPTPDLEVLHLDRRPSSTTGSVERSEHSATFASPFLKRPIHASFSQDQ